MSSDKDLRKDKKRGSRAPSKNNEKHFKVPSDLNGGSRRSFQKKYLENGHEQNRSSTSDDSNTSIDCNIILTNYLIKDPDTNTFRNYTRIKSTRRDSKENGGETTDPQSKEELTIIDENQFKSLLDFPRKDSTRIVPVPEIMRFMMQCLMAVELDENDARVVSNTLAMGDSYLDLPSGLLNLENYIYDIMRSECEADSSPIVLKETHTTAWVDGNNTLGPIIGNFCMDTAIKKAHKSGVGIVIVNNSNYIGNSVYYSHKAAMLGMVGLIFANTPPIMCPPGAKKVALGGNPLSFGARGKDEFVLFSMSNLATSIDKLRAFEQETESLPPNWALDREGNITTDAASALEGQCLLPLGGLENTGGHKGFGMSMMSEVLCSILGNSRYGPAIEGPKVSKSMGQCFIAINPLEFAPNGFEERTTGLMDNLRKCNPLDKKKSVLVPGDIEEYNHQKIRDEGGIHYDEFNINAANLLAKSLHVKPIHSKDLN